MTIAIDEACDTWVDLTDVTPRMRRAIRRLVATDLTADAEYVLAMSMEKFLGGVEEHGPLTLGDRGWTRAALEEVIDLSHYLQMELASRIDLGYRE